VLSSLNRLAQVQNTKNTVQIFWEQKKQFIFSGNDYDGT
jgi:hypothetical protein